VTGNAAPGAAAGTNDVDGGKTTLVSPVFDATVGGFVNPVIRYWRWYSNNLGATPGTDFWKVDISNNGGSSWVPVENTNVSSNAWIANTFMISQYLTPTTTMRLRFIAEDAADGSLVEAAVDDVQLLSFTGTAVGVPVGTAAPGLALAPLAPNPFAGSTQLRYVLDATGDVQLRIFDVGGRVVRTLVAGTQDAGPHSLEWDGRDDSGHALSSGTYFVNVLAGGRALARPVVLVR
jgi:hypothetical protein